MSSVCTKIKTQQKDGFLLGGAEEGYRAAPRRTNTSDKRRQIYWLRYRRGTCATFRQRNSLLTAGRAGAFGNQFDGTESKKIKTRGRELIFECTMEIIRHIISERIADARNRT